MNTLSKKHLGYALGAIVAFSLVLPVALGFTHTAQAAALQADELFGGKSGSDAAFADVAGLNTGGSGGLVGTIGSIIKLAMGFLGIIAVIIILLGGFKWMTSGGNDEKVKKAKALIFQGIIGLVIVLSAYAIATFVISNIITATNTPA